MKLEFVAHNIAVLNVDGERRFYDLTGLEYLLERHADNADIARAVSIIRALAR